jgi:hypothetical protein
MEQALRDGLHQRTGSLLGAGPGNVATLTAAQFEGLASKKSPQSMPACGAKTIGGAPITGCGDIFVAWRWDPKTYFQYRDATWTGTVTVGKAEPQVVKPPAD